MDQGNCVSVKNPFFLQSITDYRVMEELKLKLSAAGSRIVQVSRSPGTSVGNGVVRVSSSPAKNSVARPASGLVRLGVPIRHPSGVVAMPVSSTATARLNKPTSPMSAIRKTGASLNPQTRMVRSQPAVPSETNSKTVIDVVDLSDEDEPPQEAPPPIRPQPRAAGLISLQQQGVTGVRPRAIIRGLGPLQSSHPAPLPLLPRQLVGQGMKGLPPKPSLKIQRAQNKNSGIFLCWTLNHNPAVQAEITAYQLFAYQETAAKPDTSLWKRCDLKATSLSMAYSLTKLTG